MVDKKFCMSSYLTFRYIVDDNRDFYEGIKHRTYHLIPLKKRISVSDEKDVDKELRKQIMALENKKIGIMLSGGMDSACLASYIPGAKAYTFRFSDEYQLDELKRAEYFAHKWNLQLNYVDIDWNTVTKNVDELMKKKGAPVHSIEPQILQAARQAKSDGIEVMIIGDAADYVFGGMDGLYAKDWTYDEFKDRYTYLKPDKVLCDPEDMDFAFEKYRQNRRIDYVNFMHEYTDIESYSSYENAFAVANLLYEDPYERLIMDKPVDMFRIRNGESKYIIRALFKMKYPEMDIPQKIPMPRPVDQYFKNWSGPVRPEFKRNMNMEEFTGNQKWQLWCLERFLNNNE